MATEIKFKRSSTQNSLEVVSDLLGKKLQSTPITVECIQKE